MPLRGRPVQESGTQRDGRKPQASENSDVSLTERFGSQVNGQTAGEQTYCVKNRNAENVFRRGPGQALADIKEIRHHEDREDCRLGSDETEHRDTSAVGTSQRHLRFGQGNGGHTHSNFQSGSDGCLRSQSGRRLLTIGIAAKLYAGGGEFVDHSSVHASHGSLPAARPLKYDHSRLMTKTKMPSA